LIELYLARGKIYKHLRNFQESFNQIEFARQLDLADRYLNNKAIKYVLRIPLFEEASKLMLLFISHSAETNVFDLQTMWYEIALGEAYLKDGKYG